MICARTKRDALADERDLEKEPFGEKGVRVALVRDGGREGGEGRGYGDGERVLDVCFLADRLSPLPAPLAAPLFSAAHVPPSSIFRQGLFALMRGNGGSAQQRSYLASSGAAKSKECRTIICIASSTSRRLRRQGRGQMAYDECRIYNCHLGLSSRPPQPSDPRCLNCVANATKANPACKKDEEARETNVRHKGLGVVPARAKKRTLLSGDLRFAALTSRALPPRDDLFDAAEDVISDFS